MRKYPMKRWMRSLLIVGLFNSAVIAMQYPELTFVTLEQKKNDILKYVNQNAVLCGGEALQFKSMVENYSFTQETQIRKRIIGSLVETFFTPALTQLFFAEIGSMDFVKKRLLKEEIILVNQLNTELPLPPLRPMIGRIVTNDGGAVTGLLIALPNVDQPNEPIWAVLTCGHVLNLINKADDNEPGNLKFFVSNHLLTIDKIKVYRRAGKHVNIQNLPLSPIENLGGTDNLQDITYSLDPRAITRYDNKADVALCFLDISPQIKLMLNQSFTPSAVEWKNNTLSYNVLLNNELWKIGLHFVNEELVYPKELKKIINNIPKVQHGIAGYTPFGFTYSKTRQDEMALYDKFIVDVDLYGFHHDAPTYEGMSGGPIFYVDNQARHIYIYGVVVGHDPEINIHNHKLCSRCKGAFLQRSLLP